MANAYATKLAEGFASRLVNIYYARSVAEMITNQDYEGEIKDEKSVLNILTFGALTLGTFTGANMAMQDPTESNGQLVTDQQKYYYFRIKSLSRFQSWIKNPEGTLLDQLANELKKQIDLFVLGLYTKVAAGNRIGTDYTTGSVTIDAAGNVTGSGTTFNAAMVGRGFKAAGHLKWYRVATFTDTTHMTIVDDLDDGGTGVYTGGAIGAGATFTAEANTYLVVSKTTIYSQLTSLKTKLDQLEIPTEDRFFVAPSEICNLFLSAPELIPAVPTAYENVIQNGRIGTIAGFTVYSSERVSGSTSAGWHCLAGHKSGITFAMGYVETGIEDAIGNFGKAYKGLTVYGAKVVDERRKTLAELFCHL